METIIDKCFKIDFFLDTNILVDYIQGENKKLVDSLEFLANSDFVTLHSSHYVEFEFTEVRKRNEFFRIAHGKYPPKDFLKEKNSFWNWLKQKFHKVTNAKNYGTKNWKDSGFDYLDYKEDIGKVIKDDIVKLKNQLHIDFDDHVLHEKLVHTACEIVLETKISREDSMVLVSCVLPTPVDYLDFCVILTNDNQYYNAYMNSKKTIDGILDKENIPHIHKFLNTKHIGNVNLYSSESIDIKSFWNEILIKLIKSKNKSSYLGHTIIPNEKSRKRGDVWFDIEDKKKELFNSEGLVFIDKDLTLVLSVSKDFDYWQNSKCETFPYSNSEDTEYSMHPNIDESMMIKLQEKGILVFYDNIIDPHYTPLNFDL